LSIVEMRIHSCFRGEKPCMKQESSVFAKVMS
jgi:hypothetical protein